MNDRIIKLVGALIFIIATSVLNELIANDFGVELTGPRTGRIIFFMIVMFQGMGIAYVLRQIGT